MSNSTPKHFGADAELVNKNFCVADLMDPRSPTTVFQRTPIQVILKNSPLDDTLNECNSTSAVISSPVSFVSLSSHLERDESLNLSDTSSSFVTIEDDLGIESVNFSSQDWSAMVSDISLCSEEGYQKIDIKADCDNSIGVPELTKKVKNINLEKSNPCSKESSMCDSIVMDDSPTDNKQPLIKNPTKKLFYTPNKKRNPLGAVDNICPTTPPSHFSFGSPQNVLREKQWKRIQEERKKLGLESDENLPLPLYDITASAPSKLTLRKHKMQERLLQS